MKARVLERIAAEGPLPFDTYMEMCLYDPAEGFFTSGSLRPGTEGDFVTSPEVSPWFGRLLGRWARDNRPSSNAILIEIGSGSGSLLEPLVSEVSDVFRSVLAVELSENAKMSIDRRIPQAAVVGSLHDVPRGADAVVVLNEVLDNLPTRLVERGAAGWMEMRINDGDGRLSTQLAPADAALAQWCDVHLAGAPIGALMAAQTGLSRWLADVVDHLGSVRMCIVDYGGDTNTLATRRRTDVIRTFRRQRTGFDFLDEPGATDMTVDVNEDVVRAVVADLEGEVVVIDQRSFLIGLGADELLAELAHRGFERARDGDVMGQLRLQSEATDLRALIDRDGFGSFLVFDVACDTGT
jgi:SAM-dependent MidA family methyltransferase